MEQNPYEPPLSDVKTDRVVLAYAGFWIRVGASIIDSILILLVTFPLLIAIYGLDYINSESFVEGIWDFLISWILPALAIIIFWVYRSATPGKMILKIKIVDAKTGGNLSIAQSVNRYFAYFIASLPLMLGIFWVGFDKKKQGLHDKMVGTVVVRYKKSGDDTVVFE